MGDIEATPAQLKVSAGGKGYQMCFQNEDTVHVKGSTGIMITKTKMFGLMCDRVMHHETGSWEIAGNDASVIIEMIRDVSVMIPCGPRKVQDVKT